jgi:hypothetical protein
MSVSCECCVFSGRGLCDELIARPEESCRVWCVWVWSWSLDTEGAHRGICAVVKKGNFLRIFPHNRRRNTRVKKNTQQRASWLLLFTRYWMITWKKMR